MTDELNLPSVRAARADGKRFTETNRRRGVVGKTVNLDRKIWHALEVIWRVRGATGLGEWFNTLVAKLVQHTMTPEFREEVAEWLVARSFDAGRLKARQGCADFHDDDYLAFLFDQLEPGEEMEKDMEKQAELAQKRIAEKEQEELELDAMRETQTLTDEEQTRHEEQSVRLARDAERKQIAKDNAQLERDMFAEERDILREGNELEKELRNRD